MKTQHCRRANAQTKSNHLHIDQYVCVRVHSAAVKVQIGERLLSSQPYFLGQIG